MIMPELLTTIQRYESGHLDEFERVVLFQTLLDSQKIFDMPANYAMTALSALRSGVLIAPTWLLTAGNPDCSECSQYQYT